MKPDYCLRLTAQWQRGVFGGPVFGRRLVRRAARGIEVYRVVAFGQDYNIKHGPMPKLRIS